VDLEILRGQIVAKLPADRRKIMEALVAEFAPEETMRLLLALIAAANRRERQMLRLLRASIRASAVSTVRCSGILPRSTKASSSLSGPAPVGAIV
jgi:hypothetical protein